MTSSLVRDVINRVIAFLTVFNQPKGNLREQLMNSIRNPPKGRNYLNKVKRKSCLHWYLGEDQDKTRKSFIPAYKDVKAATRTYENRVDEVSVLEVLMLSLI